MKRIISITAFFFTFLFLHAQESFKITHGPYLCNPEQDGVNIVWTTNLPAMSWVEVAPDDGTHFYAVERKKYFASKSGRKIVNKTLHHVRIEGLDPGTTYRYRVVSKEVTEWKSQNKVYYGRVASTDVYRKKPLTFRTSKSNADSISFVVFNDVHGRAADMKAMSKGVDFSALDMIILNGDMASHLESEAQLFSEYIDSLVSMGASRTPLVYTRGNHETRGLFADELIHYFPTRNREFYQFFTIGETAFLILDCGEDKPDTDIEYNELADFDVYREKEAAWLKKVVESPEYKRTKTRIAILHIPVAGDGSWHGNVHLRQTLLPVLNNAGIQVMFSGHTHQYSYHPAKTGYINFPNLVNDNDTYLKCLVTGGKTKVEVIGAKGVLHTHTFD